MNSVQIYRHLGDISVLLSTMALHVMPYVEEPKLKVHRQYSEIIRPVGTHRKNAFDCIRRIHHILSDEYTEYLEEFSSILWQILHKQDNTDMLRRSDIGGLICRISSDVAIKPDLCREIMLTKKRVSMTENLYLCIEQHTVDMAEVYDNLMFVVHDKDECLAIYRWFVSIHAKSSEDDTQ